MTASRAIDLHLHGLPKQVCCYITANDVLVDPGPGSCVQTLLKALGDQRPRAIALTHIHLDHAGGVGALAEYWPGIPIYVHELGAPHLIDPTRLMTSARRIYGTAMQTLWGDILPVPPESIRPLHGDGGSLDIGLRWRYTPGHAVHHVAFLDDVDGYAYVGDVAGVRMDRGAVVAPTPPPDVDISAWRTSIDTIVTWRPKALAVAHFGLFRDVPEHLSELQQALERVSQHARANDVAAFTEELRNGLGDDPHLDAHTSSWFSGARRWATQNP